VSETSPTLVAALRRRGISDVDDSTLTRALYSSDASLYRVVSQVVVRPRHPDELLAVLDVSRETGAPVTMRGAGTSIAAESHQPDVLMQMVRIGLGWTVLPVPYPVPDVAQVEIGPQLVERVLVVARRSESISDPAVDEFARRLQA
jgi:DNA-binding transcriptional LysR family regulator